MSTVEGSNAPDTGSGHEVDYDHGGLKKETNWWGAFVIGLAGVILVTGIAPVMVTTLGAASIPLIIVITFMGFLLCLMLAEMAAMMPERTGGLPSFVYPAFREKTPRLSKHLNGGTAWAYWLGWFPVAPLNMILASFYIADRLNLNTEAGFTPINTFISWWTLGIAIVGILLFAIPAVLGIRIGAAFATVLGLLSMIPLTFLAVAWIFGGNADIGNVTGFTHLDGSSFFSPLDGEGWLTICLAYGFLLTWNVLAMEAAACYIGECHDPERDAKIAMNLEGGYGLFIYTLIPVGFIAVLGAEALSNPDLVDPNTIFVNFAGEIFGTGGELLNWIIAVMLIVALALSALNAILGCARSLHQMSVDGHFPRFFSRVNKHGVPSRAALFNVAASLIVVLAGGAVEIYTFSNVGYTSAIIVSLVAYFMLRQFKPNAKRPFRLPGFFKWVALIVAACLFVMWSYGGYQYSRIGDTRIYFFLGFLVLLAYIPLHYYRTHVEDRREPPPGPTEQTAGMEERIHEK